MSRITKLELTQRLDAANLTIIELRSQLSALQGDAQRASLRGAKPVDPIVAARRAAMERARAAAMAGNKCVSVNF